MYNFCVNVTVVIEHIVLLTAARALISVSYVYLRLFYCLCLSFLSQIFIKETACLLALYYVTMSCI